MSRNLVFNNALVLRVRPFGEANREAVFLTTEEGIVNVVVFGGPRSKLRAAISPFHQGNLYLYLNPMKDSRKAVDFDVKIWRPGLREDFGRAMAAGAVSGTVSATHAGGGDWARALELASASLTALETADESACIRVFIHFLWNWLGLIGEKPSLSHCAVCGLTFENSAVFSFLEQALVCPVCRESAWRTESGSLVLGPGARRWLSVTENLPPSQLGRWTLDMVSLVQARAVVTGMMALTIEKRLNIWDF
ncbi:MAG: recombination protein O N-terminal domain-containing protein [Treponema sp.]|jgi:DNA repair protein RecO (recombination protein O)|nr:recombination protein O N-terminal domain-containing protein [Treponema sp.]